MQEQFSALDVGYAAGDRKSGAAGDNTKAMQIVKKNR